MRADRLPSSFIVQNQGGIHLLHKQLEHTLLAFFIFYLQHISALADRLRQLDPFHLSGTACIFPQQLAVQAP
ncbi:MAG: hypothetical protein KatS3mg033_0579 [Thermonema sp.]|nr:MAG: hypothetical protein KatS3mg033_0579 [Thermonema sp.]